MPVTSRLVTAVLVLASLAACTAMEGVQGESGSTSAAAAPSPTPPVLTPYLDTLARMGPGDPARQEAELTAALAAAQEERSPASVLRYALALGSAGHPRSNPVEAKRLITELLASPNTLDPVETAFATAFLREFDARVELYAELARQREESELKLRSLDATADRRAESLAVENKALRRALAAAERKLEAVAEMERSLLEQAPEAAPEAPPKP